MSSTTTPTAVDYKAMADKLSAAAVIGHRRDSRKRRRLSERRRVFSRAMNNKTANAISNNDQTTPSGRTLDEHRRSDSPTLVGGDSVKMSMKIQFHITVAPEDEPLILDTNHLLASAHTAGSLTGSTLAAVAAATATATAAAPQATDKAPPNSLERGSNLRGSRRSHLLALHNKQAQNVATNETVCTHSTGDLTTTTTTSLSPKDTCNTCRKGSLTPLAATGGRDSGVRSSTITGGMADESTMRFLASRLEQPSTHLVRSSTNAVLARSQPVATASGSTPTLQLASGASGSLATSSGTIEREQIYFKRDGQRFGHEFTLKLAVDRTYRCLLKVRPLIPLQSISIQGHQVVFVDCSQGGGLGGDSNSTSGANPSSGRLAPASGSSSLNGLMHDDDSFLSTTMQQNSNNIRAMKLNGNGSGSRRLHQSPGGSDGDANANEFKFQSQDQPSSSSLTTVMKSASATTTTLKSTSSQAIFASTSNQQHNSIAGAQHHNNHRATGVLQHAQTVCSGPTAFSLSRQLQQQLLQQQQRQQMIRHFAVAHCTSSSSHLGSQLIYMFDWPAARFEANKNKNRTHVQTVLKFRNGQVLSLPLQVKFYQAERKQHLNWGSRLHFIDYDCNINSMGQINVDKIQYY